MLSDELTPIVAEDTYGETEPVVIPAVEIKGMPEDFNELLKHVAYIAREKAAEVALKVDPTNVFANRLKAIADANDAFVELCEERGHRGIPDNG